MWYNEGAFGKVVVFLNHLLTAVVVSAATVVREWRVRYACPILTVQLRTFSDSPSSSYFLKKRVVFGATRFLFLRKNT